MRAGGGVEIDYCRRCGRRLLDSMRFCDECGHPTAQGVHRVAFGTVVHRQRKIPRRISDTLDDLVLYEQLGEGGMGRVYRAMSCTSGQPFAVKVLHPDRNLRAAAIRRLGEEAASQALLVHPNIVRVFRFVHAADRGAIVMELVPGETLAAVIVARRGNAAFTLGVLDLALQVVQALSVVHEAGYVHADVKPTNFLMGVDRSGRPRVKITDFGIARRVQSELTSRSKVVAGTPGFMPPEQLLGQPLDATTDLYALGCVLHELFAGEPVFVFDSLEACIYQHMYADPPRLPPRSAPSALADLVAALLAKSRAQRPRSARDVYRQLEVIRRGGDS